MATLPSSLTAATIPNPHDDIFARTENECATIGCQESRIPTALNTPGDAEAGNSPHSVIPLTAVSSGAVRSEVVRDEGMAQEIPRSRRTIVNNTINSNNVNNTTINGNVNHIYNYPVNVQDRVSVDDVEKWLGYHSFSEIYRISQDQRMPGTGTWFLECEEFKKFIDNAATILWGEGMPGSGKTVLAGAIIEALKKMNHDRPNVAVAYAFLRYTETLSARKILTSLLCQTLRACPSALDAIRPIYLQHRAKDEALTNRNLIATFQAAVTASQRVYIVIDGLDEADNGVKDELLPILTCLGPSNLLILSRPLDTYVRTHTPSAVRISIQANTEDIDRFVRAKAETNTRLKGIIGDDPETVNKLSLRIQLKSRGMFLVARLQMEELARGPNTLEGLFQTLDTLPSGIKEMYEVSLSRIEQSSLADASLARHVFTWLLTSNRAFPCEDLADALAFSFEEMTLSSNRKYTRKSILSACGGLVEIEGKSDQPTKHDVFRFIHYSTEETLKLLLPSWFPNPHTLLTVACISYVIGKVGDPRSHGGSEEALQQKLRSTSSFGSYAWANWKDHARKAFDAQGAVVDPSIVAAASSCTTFPFLLDQVIYCVSGLAVLKFVALEGLGADNLPLVSWEDEAIILENLSASKPDIYIEKAIQTYRTGLSPRPGLVSNLAGYLPRGLRNLTDSLHGLIQADPIGHAEALSAERRELAAMKGEPLPRPLHGYARSVWWRFLRTKRLVDLKEVASTEARALSAMPHGHPELAALIANLGLIYLRLHQTSIGAPKHLLEGVSCFRTAATYPYAPPKFRLLVAEHWAQQLQEHNPESSNLPSALKELGAALWAVETFTMSLDRMVGATQRSSLHSRVLATASAGAYAAIRGCHLDTALNLIERGCCLGWNHLKIDARSSLDDLLDCDRTLAEELIRTAKGFVWSANSDFYYPFWGLHSPLLVPSTRESLQEEAQQNLDRYERWNFILARIRNTPRFGTFLLPPPFSELNLAHLPPSGFVVALTTNGTRCDAVVITSGRDGPHHWHIPFPRFTFQDADKLAWGLINYNLRYSKQTQAVKGGGLVRGIKLPASQNPAKVLRTLWHDLVKPIIETIGLSKVVCNSDKAPPRIWWCPTGVLSLLPIHAAGTYLTDDPASEGIMDYAVSSYIPSITSLLEQVQTSQAIDKKSSNPFGILLIGQPESSQPHGTFPGIGKEVASIYREASDRGVQAHLLEGEQLSVVNVLQRLDQYSCVHIAYHPVEEAEVDAPVKQCLRVSDGLLRLKDIMRADIKNADLAFLSGCQSGRGGSEPGSEGFHLASGMLAAGFRRVIATQWSIRDDEAPQVARDFYDYMWRRAEGEGTDGVRFVDGAYSAEALHHATLQLRSRLEASGTNKDTACAIWAPYVHWGY